MDLEHNRLTLSYDDLIKLARGEILHAVGTEVRVKDACPGQVPGFAARLRGQTLVAESIRRQHEHEAALLALGWEHLTGSCDDVRLHHWVRLDGTDHGLGIPTVPHKHFVYLDGLGVERTGTCRTLFTIRRRHDGDLRPTTPGHPRWHLLMDLVRFQLGSVHASHAYMIHETVCARPGSDVTVAFRGATLRVGPLL